MRTSEISHRSDQDVFRAIGWRNQLTMNHPGGVFHVCSSNGMIYELESQGLSWEGWEVDFLYGCYGCSFFIILKYLLGLFLEVRDFINLINCLIKIRNFVWKSFKIFLQYDSIVGLWEILKNIQRNVFLILIYFLWCIINAFDCSWMVN